MPHRMPIGRASRAAALLLAASLLPACASGGGGGGAPSRPSGDSPSSPSADAPRGAPASDSGDAAKLPEKGVKAGWMDYRPARKAGQITTLTLLSQGTQEGKLILRGRARMEGGKVVDDKVAADMLRAFEDAGFDRFAVKRNPNEPAPGALQVVWLDRGNGLESLYLLPGARANSATHDAPDVFDAIKKLIFTIHQASPGSMVVTGEGWSGDSMMNQKAGGRPR